MIEKYGCIYSASSKDNDFSLSNEEKDTLDELLNAVRSSLYQLVNEASEGNLYNLQWKESRIKVVQSVAQIDEELTDIIQKARDLWFYGNPPIIEETGDCVDFTNYYSTGEVFNGTIFYED